MDAILRKLLVEWLVSLDVWTSVAPAGRGLTGIAAATRLVYPTMGYGRSDRHRLSAPLKNEVAAEVADRLAQKRDLISEQLVMIRAAIDDAVELAGQLNACTTINDLGSKILGQVGRWNAEGRTVTEDQLDTMVSAHLHNLVSADRVFEREDFVEFQTFFDQKWDEEGARNLKDFSYSKFLLGLDVRPPLCRSAEENTWAGLGRSVYSRYRIAARDPKVQGDADAVANAEIIRACGRLGLRDDPGLVVLTSLFLGMYLGPQEAAGWKPPRNRTFDHSWRQVPGPIRPTSDEAAPGPSVEPDGSLTGAEPDPADLAGIGNPFLHLELARQAQAGIAKFSRLERQGWFLWGTNRAEEAHEDVMRRAWMACFEFDRREAAVLSAAEASKLVNKAIRFAIPSGQLYRHKVVPASHSERSGAADDTTEVDAAIREISGESGPANAYQRSLMELAGAPELGKKLLAGDPVALAEYASLARTHDLLPWAEFRNVVIDQAVGGLEEVEGALHD